MGRLLSPRYDHVILVSRYPVLTATKLTKTWMRSIRLQAPTITRKVEHWFTCGADGRTDVQSRDYQNFLGWKDNQIFLSQGYRWRYDTHFIKEEGNRLTSLCIAEEPTLHSTSRQIFPLNCSSPRQSGKSGWKEGREEGKVQKQGRKKGRERKGGKEGGRKRKGRSKDKDKRKKEEIK